MNVLFDFKKEEGKLVGTVHVPKEKGLEAITNAVTQFSLGDGGIMQKQLQSGYLNPNDGWRQIFCPDPVLHWQRQEDGSYSVKVYESVNGKPPYSEPKKNSAKLLEYLQQYASNGNGTE